MYDIKYVTKRNINIFICQIILKFIIEKIWIELSKLFNIIIKKKIKLRNLYYLYLYKNVKYILILQITILYYYCYTKTRCARRPSWTNKSDTEQKKVFTGLINTRGYYAHNKFYATNHSCRFGPFVLRHD